MKSFDFKRFKVKNCKAFWVGEMLQVWYSTGEVALNMFRFVYRFECAIMFQTGKE